ncbi:MAG: (d)CMP kinase [Parachlamydiales bacterium]
MIIAIDGPSGTGKSSTARLLAETLGYAYFDTGAMYRAVTYLFLKEGVDLADDNRVRKLLYHLHFRIQKKGGVKRYFINDEEVTEEIRSPRINQHVSAVAALPAVREALVPIQRDFGQIGDSVFEGRDIGTVVFPNAEVKIFLTARPEVRAKRRYQELITKQPELIGKLTEEEVLAEQEKRDAHDSTRAHSPLRPAEGAYILDTSDMTLMEATDHLYHYILHR